MTNYYTKRRLSEKDKKVLKHQCRAGIVIFILCTPILFSVVYILSDQYFPKYISLFTSITSSLLIMAITSYTMMRKYIRDIKNDEKELYLKTITRKEQVTDYEAGSGIVGKIGKDMKLFTQYSFIIDNIRYKVEEDLFQKLEEGEEVFFAIAPISRYQLEILQRT